MTVAPVPAASDLLAAIVAATRCMVASRRARVAPDAVAARAMERSPRGDLFSATLARPDRVNVIAECKRRSPSKGLLRREYDPAGLAASYALGGAAAVSVLTEPTFFDGSLADLEAVRAAVDLPLLRKDFIVDTYQLLEARAAGADAVLLIVAALPRPDLHRYLQEASGLGLAALVEVHDEGELGVAIDAGARVIGVNSRNLRTLDVDARVCERLAARIPRGIVAVAESGLKSHQDVRQMRAAGYSAFLIGEWLVTQNDPAAALRAVVGAAGA